MGGVTVVRARAACMREPLAAPFGFKGRAVDCLWNIIVELTFSDGSRVVGLGVQSPLWADADVFAALGSEGSNAAMLSVTRRALGRLTGRTLGEPGEMTAELLADLYADVLEITGLGRVQLTFLLNALVPVDMALWKAYCAARSVASFYEMIPPGCRAAFAYRHDRCVNIPLITYATPDADILRLAREGTPLFKIKLGKGDSGPQRLAWDRDRVTRIHGLLKGFSTGLTQSGRIGYYLDANGLYESREDVAALLEYLESIGALGRLLLFEEPFTQDSDLSVAGLPAVFAADESASSVTEVRRRLALGYRAVALKPMAKTVSLSFEIARVCHEAGAACFCADLTVNPAMVDWNKNFAVRMEKLPGMKAAVLESNGAENYARWEALLAMHPAPDGGWIRPRSSVFWTGPDFYASSGGVLGDYPAYAGALEETGDT